MFPDTNMEELNENLGGDTPEYRDLVNPQEIWREIISDRTQKGCEEIYIYENNTMQFHQRGKLESMDFPPQLRGTFSDMVSMLVGRSDYDYKKQPDGFETSAVVAKRRYRVSIMNALGGGLITMRPYPLKIPDVNQLDMPHSIVEAYMRYQNGLVLIGGQTGAGKSTTLASLNLYRGMNIPERIFTLEDPVEYVYPAMQHTVFTQLQKHVHFTSINAIMEKVMRHSPTIISVGEIRNPEEASAAIHGAQGGHLIVATIHANNSIDMIDRMRGFSDPSGSRADFLNRFASLFRLGVTQQLYRNESTDQRVAIYEYFQRGDDADVVEAAIRDGDYKRIKHLINNNDNMATFKQSLRQRQDEGLLSANIELQD